MKLVSNVRMRTKLALMLCLPLLALLYFSVDAAWERWRQAREMESLLVLSELAVKSSALVHESQKERGMTALYLGSKGTRYQAELTAQHAATDARATALRQHLARLERDRIGGDLLRSLDDAVGRLAKVAATREAARAMSIAAPDAIAYYTDMNRAFLTMIARASHLSDRGELTRGLAAYAAFLHVKDEAGLERATLSNTFAQDAFGPGMFERFLGVVTAQETYGAMFEALATAADRDLARKTVSGAAVESAARMRKVALDRAATGGFGIEPGEWFTTMTGKIELMKRVEDQLSEGLVGQASRLRSRAWAALVAALGLGLGSVAVASVVAAAVARTITRSLRAILATMRELAEGEGDLTRRLAATGGDELGELAAAFNAFMDKLRAILDQVKDAAGHSGTAARELSAAAGQLSDGAQEQASALEETAASLEEITGTVKQTADNARLANQLSLGSRDVAEQGGQVVADAVASMNAINEASRRIAQIITTIDEIAFQTNLLALNAAVEAARAGEQGRGFAVVAAEVRNLAQRSASAAKEIKSLIQDSVQKVDAGSTLVNKSGATLGEIVGAVKRVTDLIAEIAAASGEQSAGIDQVNRAVAQMDHVTQSNAAQTEELSSTAQSLASEAERLQALVGRFKLDAGGATAARPAMPASPPPAAAPGAPRAVEGALA